jgi:hypothetical protein
MWALKLFKEGQKSGGSNSRSLFAKRALERPRKTGTAELIPEYLRFTSKVSTSNRDNAATMRSAVRVRPMPSRTTTSWTAVLLRKRSSSNSSSRESNEVVPPKTSMSASRVYSSHQARQRALYFPLPRYRPTEILTQRQYSARTRVRSCLLNAGRSKRAFRGVRRSKRHAKMRRKTSSGSELKARGRAVGLPGRHGATSGVAMELGTARCSSLLGSWLRTTEFCVATAAQRYHGTTRLIGCCVKCCLPVVRLPPLLSRWRIRSDSASEHRCVRQVARNGLEYRRESLCP